MNKLTHSPRRILSPILATVVLLLVMLACAGSASAPDSSGEAPPQATTSPSIINPTAVVAAVQPAMPERRFLTLEFPPKIRAGDSDIVRLTLEIDENGNIVPTAEIAGNVVSGKVVDIPNLYETHHVIAEARFDIAGVDVSPTELISEPLTQGTSATFYWSIRPREVGVFRGTIWLYLRFVDKLTGEESRKTVSAQIVQIEAQNILGLPANVARWLGVVGSFVGAVVGFPFLEDSVKFIVKKRLKK